MTIDEVALNTRVPRTLKRRIRDLIREQGDQKQIVIEALEIGIAVIEQRAALEPRKLHEPVAEQKVG